MSVLQKVDLPNEKKFVCNAQRGFHHGALSGRSFSFRTGRDTSRTASATGQVVSSPQSEAARLQRAITIHGTQSADQLQPRRSFSGD